MAMVTVYKFRVPDPITVEMRVAPRKATLEAIRVCRGVPIKSSAEEVAESRLDGNGFVISSSED